MRHIYESFVTYCLIFVSAKNAKYTFNCLFRERYNIVYHDVTGTVTSKHTRPMESCQTELVNNSGQSEVLHRVGVEMGQHFHAVIAKVAKVRGSALIKDTDSAVASSVGVYTVRREWPKVPLSTTMINERPWRRQRGSH